MAYTQQKKESSKKKQVDSIEFPESTFLQSSKFDDQSGTLTVDFKNGTQIVYQNIDGGTWQRFKMSPSKGSFYSREIKNQYGSNPFKSSLRVSDLEKAIRKNRPVKKGN